MSNKKITTEFFAKPTIEVAKNLLGKYLVRKISSAHSGQVDKIITGKIIETEAYCGLHDLACHASKGRTKRTEIMFGKPGLIYVYLVYGMYYCLNIVTEREEYPAAVLIRGVKVKQSTKRLALSDTLILDGPGKLCRYFKIDRSFYGIDICRNNKLWIEDRRERNDKKNILATSRIGINYAGEYKNKLWRFLIK